MNADKLLPRVKTALLEIEPTAEVILFGSRARGDAQTDSDWDFLVLVDGMVDEARRTRLYDHMYQLEWELGFEVMLSFLLNSHQQWQTSRYQALPLAKNVRREGVLV